MTSSILSLHGRAGLSGYCSAKTGLTGLVRVLACEFGDKGIRVNGVGPGFIATDLTADIRGQPGFSDKVISRTPLGRWGTPDDVCGPALFLASDAADFIHDQILFVHGGLTASY